MIVGIANQEKAHLVQSRLGASRTRYSNEMRRSAKEWGPTMSQTLRDKKRRQANRCGHVGSVKEARCDEETKTNLNCSRPSSTVIHAFAFRLYAQSGFGGKAGERQRAQVTPRCQHAAGFVTGLSKGHRVNHNAANSMELPSSD